MAELQAKWAAHAGQVQSTQDPPDMAAPTAELGELVADVKARLA